MVDTWSAAPVAVQTSARLLSGRAVLLLHLVALRLPVADRAGLRRGLPGRRRRPRGRPTAATTLPPSAAASSPCSREFDGDVALMRAGLILGPYEIVGRMPFWLNRIAAGGRVPAPGPHDRPLQYVDCRDIADWVLGSRPVGTFNTVSEPGHTTIGALLDEVQRRHGQRAELVWLTPTPSRPPASQPWTELPIWVPPTGSTPACTTATCPPPRPPG